MKKTALVLTLALLLSAIAVESQIVNLANAQPSIVSFQILQQREVVITINDDGSIEGTNQIQRNLNTYTFTGNISGNIQVRKSNIIIDGAGFTLNGNNDTGIDTSNEIKQVPSEREIWNVTVKNLRIINCRRGVWCDFGGNHTFYGNYISNDFITRNETRTGNLSGESIGIALWGSRGNNITHCTIGGSPAIYMHFACVGNIVTENNIVFGAHLAISGNETFDRNYWGDYLSKYPNASEVDSSGVWDMPYAFADSTDFENRTFKDNHPLVSPLAIPNFSSTLPVVQSIQEPMAIPVVLIAVSIIGIVLAATGLLVYFRRRK